MSAPHMFISRAYHRRVEGQTSILELLSLIGMNIGVVSASDPVGLVINHNMTSFIPQVDGFASYRRKGETRGR